MRTLRLLSAIFLGLSASLALASTALADTVPVSSDGPLRPGNSLNPGDSMNVSVTGTAGAGEIFTMDYPGGNAQVVINARIDGISQTENNTAGVDVYDSLNPGHPVEHLTLGTNGFNHDPNLMEFVYSSGTPGPVTFQFFNWSQKPVTLEVMPVTLPVPLVDAGPSIPGAATAVGISGVAGVQISRG